MEYPAGSVIFCRLGHPVLRLIVPISPGAAVTTRMVEAIWPSFLPPPGVDCVCADCGQPVNFSAIVRPEFVQLPFGMVAQILN